MPKAAAAAATHHRRAARMASGPAGRNGRPAHVPAMAVLCNKYAAATTQMAARAKAYAIASATCSRVRSNKTFVRISVPPTTMCPTMVHSTRGRRTTTMWSHAR